VSTFIHVDTILTSFLKPFQTRLNERLRSFYILCSEGKIPPFSGVSSIRTPEGIISLASS